MHHCIQLPSTTSVLCFVFTMHLMLVLSFFWNNWLLPHQNEHCLKYIFLYYTNQRPPSVSCFEIALIYSSSAMGCCGNIQCFSACEVLMMMPRVLTIFLKPKVVNKSCLYGCMQFDLQVNLQLAPRSLNKTATHNCPSMQNISAMQAFRVVVHNIFLLTASAWDLISMFPQILQTAECCHNSAGVQWNFFNSSETCAQYNAAFGTTGMSQQGLLVPFADFPRRSRQYCLSTSPTATSASIKERKME